MPAAAIHNGVDTTKSVFTTGDVAKLIGVATRTVTKFFDEGLLKGYRLPTGSRDRRMPRESLVAFLRQHDISVPGLYEAEARGEEF